ncbi:MAG: substrate-binding periplasmic protein, partial [Gammaproteobacteria bacterium]
MRYSHGLLTCLYACATLAVHADTALDRIRDRGTLEVAVYDDFPPFSVRAANGKDQGIDVDLANELARRLGVKASIRFQTADESVEDDLRNAIWKGHYLGGGVADVMLHVPADPRFVNSVDEVVIGGVYYTEDIALAYDRRQFPQAPALAAFETAKVGVEIETIADLYLLGADNGRLRNQVIHFPKLAAASVALKTGEVPAIMGQRAELQGLLRDDKH